MSGCGGGGHPGGGYGGHHPGYGGGNVNTNVNVNVNANAGAYAGSYAGAGAVINARGYDVGAIRGGGGYGGAIVSGSGYGGWDSLGYGGSVGAVVVRGPGYGPSRPFGYAVRGFGRRYVTTDRCGSCGAPPPPPPSCYVSCDGGYDHGNRYSDRDPHGRSDCRCGGPSYVAQPHYAAPQESVEYRNHDYQASVEGRGYVQQGYSSGGYEHYDGQPYGSGHGAPVHAPRPYAPAAHAPRVIEQAPVYIQAPPGYYGDLPPDDDGVSLPYRQEPGERG
jgi:hypothetical protein